MFCTIYVVIFLALIFIFGVYPSIKKYWFDRKKKLEKKSVSYEFNSRESSSKIDTLLEKNDSHPPPPSFPPPLPPKMQTFGIQDHVIDPQLVNSSSSNTEFQDNIMLDLSTVKKSNRLTSSQSNSSLYTLSGQLRGLNIQPKRNYLIT